MTFDPTEPDVPAEEVQEVVDETIESAEIAMFVKGTRHMPQCGYSDRALSLVHHYRDEEDVAVVDALQNMDAFREALEEHSGWTTTPQTYVDGEFVGGSDILVELAERGELGETLNVPSKSPPPEFSDEPDESDETAGAEAPF